MEGEPEQPALPDMELINIIQEMSPHDRIVNKRRALQEISDREQLIRMIDEANAIDGVNVTIIY